MNRPRLRRMLDRGVEMPIVSDAAILAAGQHHQAHQGAEISPYVWVHPVDEDRR
jgi:hypothetical protein